MNHSRKNIIFRHCFTLMEMIVASAILAMSAVATMSIIAGARSSMLRAEKRWGRQHLLAQAAELYLLGGPRAVIPDGLLPQGFSTRCTLYEVEDIHEEGLEHIKGWCLGEFHIEIFDVSGVLMAETRIRKLLKEEDLES